MKANKKKIELSQHNLLDQWEENKKSYNQAKVHHGGNGKDVEDLT